MPILDFLFIYLNQYIMNDSNMTALKLKELSQKMSSLSFCIEKQEQVKAQTIQQHIHRLEESFNKQKPAQQSKIQLIKEQIQRSSEVVKTELNRVAAKSGLQQEKTTLFKNSIQNWIQGQRQKQNNQKTARADVNSSELMSLCEMIENQQNSLYDKFEGMYSNITSKVNKLKEDIIKEESEREDNVLHVGDQMQSQIDAFNHSIDLQIKQRQQSETKIRIMVGQIKSKLQTQIQKQTKRRSESNDLMLQLLETACQKLERRGK